MVETILALVIGGVLILALLYVRVRRAIGQYAHAHRNSWDEMMISRLRAEGYHPFNEYRIDFFLALPDEAACNAVRGQLEPEGFEVDVKPIDEQSDLPFSLHASKSMQLIVPDLQAHSRRMSDLAMQFGGRYDHWAA